MKGLNTIVTLLVLAGGAGLGYVAWNQGWFTSAAPVDDHGHAHAADEHAHGDEEHHHDEGEGHVHDDGEDGHDPAEDEEHKHGEPDHGHDHGAEAGHGDSVTLSEDALAVAKLGLAKAGPAQLRTSVSLPGEVKLNADTLVHIVPRVSGIARIVNKNLGDTVVAGDVLAVLDSRELADAKSAYLASTERVRLAESRHQREKELYERKVSSQEDYLSAEAALAEARIDMRSASQKLHALGADAANLKTDDEGLTAYEVRSPINGVILDKHVSVGEALSEGVGLFVIADLSTVWVEVTVYAQDLGRVREGRPVTIHSDDLGLTAEGTLSYIGALVGVESRSAKAIVKLANPERLWRPGLFVAVDVLDEAFDVPVAIEEEALQTFEGTTVVFTKHGNRFDPHVVSLGRRAQGYVEVLSGLVAGEEYVTTNSYIVKAELEKAGATHEH